MAWTKENGPDGLPLWRGNDSIQNITSDGQRAGGCVKLSFTALPFAVSFLAAGRAAQDIALTLMTGRAENLISAAICAALAFGGFKLGRKMLARQKPVKDWLGQEWALLASSDGLTFTGGQKWAVPLDAVARVETALTAQYSPSRDYAALGGMAGVLPVPAHEWQTFLFLNDGTRRVIYHANAARDDCAALAASIREYVESARAGAAPSSPSTPDAAGGSAPRAAGFDL